MAYRNLSAHFCVNPIARTSANVANTELSKSFRQTKELTTFPRCVYLPVIPLNTQNTFDFSCWSPDEIMRLSAHSCTSYLDARSKFCSLWSQFFSSISVLFSHSPCLTAFFSIVSSPFSSVASIQFTTLFSVQYSPPFLPWAAEAFSRSSPLCWLLILAL